MKLKNKTEINGKNYRKHEKAKTPYQRIMESSDVGKEVKEELEKACNNLNPAELKRGIDGKVKKLYECYKKKKVL